jgi:hypothetical protein
MPKNKLRIWIVFGLYLLSTVALLLLGYSVQKPVVTKQEFPFTITYCYQGETKTISDVYVVEYERTHKYIGDNTICWNGYIKDHDQMQADYYRVIDLDNELFAINVNFVPEYFMGDPEYAQTQCAPTANYYHFDGVEEISVTDPAELEQPGFSLVSWEYPTPIENSYTYGGISLSSEATMYCALLAVMALVACMILVKKDPELTYSGLDKFSIVMNFLIALTVLPFILVASALTEIVSDATFVQQILYLSPAITAIGIALSVVLRRLGRKYVSLAIQFAGPAVFAICLLLESI